MVTVLDRKLTRDLHAARTRLAGIVVVVAIGISIFVSFVSLYANLELSRKWFYAECRMADFWVQTERIPLTEVNELKNIHGISELRPRLVQPLTVDIADVEKPIAGQLVSLPAHPTPVINNIVLKRGSYFTGLRREETILNDSFARARGLEPGDRIHILINDRQQELVLVGTAASSEFVFTLAPGSVIPDKSSFAILYVTEDFAAEIMDYEGSANEIVGLLAPEYRERPEKVLQELERRLEPYGEPTVIPAKDQLSTAQVAGAIQGLQAASFIMPPIFLGSATLILDVLMKRIVEQQRTVVGTLKALGYGNATLVWHFLKFGALVGLLGGALGAPLGYFLTGGLIYMMGQFLEFPTFVNRPYPIVILTSLGLSILFALLGTLRGLLAVLRLTPAEAMRPKPPTAGRHVWLERWRWLWRRFGFRWQMVFRGIARHKTRAFTGIFCSMVGTALIYTVLARTDSTNYMIDFTFDKMLVSDIEISLQGEVDHAAFFELRGLPGIDYAEPVLNVPCTVHYGRQKKNTAVQGIVPYARLTVPRDADGNVVQIPEAGVILTSYLAESLGARAGDTVVMIPKRGASEPIRMPVIRVVESYVGSAAYADWSYLNRLVGEDAALNQVQTLVNPREISNLYTSLKNMPKLRGFSSLRDQKQQFEDLMLTIWVANSTQILFAGLLFVASVLTASLVSLAERRQEIATLLVLGYRHTEIAMLFLRESLLVSACGMILGFPLGVWFTIVGIELDKSEQLQFPYVASVSSCVYTVAWGAIFTLVANIPVYRAIIKMNWLDALNVRE
ncbi:MAG: FtsX-like permease family protein [Planctomycetales bacterium]|nr:FtsX-like permease family protein [Planctomycetales bacterium]